MKTNYRVLTVALALCIVLHSPDRVWAGATIYVSNSGNETIEKFTSEGMGSVFASTGLSDPWGLAVDSAGNL